MKKTTRRLLIQKLTDKGVKFDDAKIMVDLVVPEFVEGLAQIMTFGAKKYGIDNWKKPGVAKRRWLAALYRHTLAYHRGEKYDPESGLHHLLHTSANCMFLYYLDEIAGEPTA